MEEIDNADGLYRRIFYQYVRKDGSISSSAYRVDGNPDCSISVYLARLTDHKAALSGYQKHGLGEIRAGYPRSIGFVVRHDPIADNYAHSLIEGQNSKTKCHQLAENTQLVVVPPPQID